MPYLEASRGYAALTPVQKEMVLRKHVEGETKFHDLLDILRAVAGFDYQRDQASTRTGCLTALVLVSALVCLAVAPPLGLLLLLVGLFLLKQSYQLSSQDLNNLLRDFVVPSMQVLGQDLAEDAPLRIDLDLRGGTRPERQVGTEIVTDPGWLAYPKIREKRFVDPWLKLSTILADGSRLTLSGTDHIRQRTITQRRRKVKTKTKYKVKRQIVLQLGVKKKQYRIAEGVARTEKGEREFLSVEKVTVHTGLDQTIGPDVFVDLMRQVYGKLGPARQEG